MRRLRDWRDRRVRLTEERLGHIERRPEMVDQLPRIEETPATPEEVRASDRDEEVHLYYRHYPVIPVTEKYLLVVVRVAEEPFVITAFYTDRVKSGRPIDG